MKFLKVCKCCLLLSLVGIGFSSCDKSTYSYLDADKYSVGGVTLSKSIERIELDWLSGEVLFEYHDNAFVSVSETANRSLEDSEKLRYWLDGTTLRINFAKPGVLNLKKLDKSLTISLPKGLELEMISANCVSASITIDAIESKNAKLSTVSGEIDAVFASDMVNCGMVSVSGGICTDVGKVENLGIDTVSGELEIYLSETINKLDVKTVSGDVDLVIDKNASFALQFVTIDGEMESHIKTTLKNGKYEYNGGSGKYTVKTTSGDLSISEIDY